MNCCFWSIGDGDYSFMLKGLIHSFHAVGMKEDFHVFSDSDIPGAMTHRVKAFDKRNFFFKMEFLRSQVSSWNYDYFVYLDADNLFLRKPKPILDLLQGSSVHCFFENDCLQPSQRKHWWGCPLEEMARMMKECGITHDRIYTLNSGFFIVQRNMVEILCDLATDFLRYAAQQGYSLPDEPGWAYAMQMLCDHPEKHLLKDHWDTWCSDWEGVFASKLPAGEPWIFKDYMTKEPHVVNPAIVHAIKSKELLIQNGLNLFQNSI